MIEKDLKKLVKEFAKASKKANTLAINAERCRNDKDKVKVASMAVIQIAYATELYKGIKSYAEVVIGMIRTVLEIPHGELIINPEESKCERYLPAEIKTDDTLKEVVEEIRSFL